MKGSDKMRASKEELPVLLQAGPAQIRGTDWDGLRVAVVSVPAGTDFGPLLAGLPNDRCSAEHWGYVLNGRLRVRYGDNSEETLQKGDYFYLPAGHTGAAEEDLEFIEISKPGGHDQFLAQARKNLAAM